MIPTCNRPCPPVGRFIYSAAFCEPSWFTEYVMQPALPPNYRPSDDEEFMNPRQLEYFRQKLLRWRAGLMAESSDTLQTLKEVSLAEADLADRATLETDRSIELRTRERELKLISKIDEALGRIDD